MIMRTTPRATGAQHAPRRFEFVLLVVAVCLVAANMRPTITAVGPLLEQIGADTGTSLATLGWLTSIPLIAWAVFSPFARALSVRFGTGPVVLWSLVLLLVATGIRSLPGVSGLWVGTALIGIGLAILNVLMPAITKRDFPTRVALMTGVYSALLGLFGAFSSGVAVPLTQLGDASSGWRLSLLISGGILLPIAIIAWGVTMRRRIPEAPRAESTGTRRGGIWSDPTAWLVALYMGFQASTFYIVVTWLAKISTSYGHSEVAAGNDVMVYQIASLAGSLGLPLVLRRRAERFVPFLLPALGIIGALGLMLAPGALTVWAVILGVFSGASLAMALTLMAHRARDHDTSAALSGMAQSVGYVIAAIGPVLFGWLHASVGGWTASLGVLLAAMVVQAGVGVFVGRERFVLEPRSGLAG